MVQGCQQIIPVFYHREAIGFYEMILDSHDKMKWDFYRSGGIDDSQNQSGDNVGF
jgi:hypothetical protein